MPNTTHADAHCDRPLLTALAALAGDVAVCLSGQGRVTWISDRGLAFLGLAGQPVLDRDWCALAVAPEDQNAARQFLAESLDASLPPAPLAGRCRLRGPDGTIRPVRVRCLRCTDGPGPARLVCVLDNDHRPSRDRERLTERLEDMVRDRTRTLNRLNEELILEVAERREAEAAMAVARYSAETASRTKSEFLAAMSHELRTPLNGILGMAQLLGTTALDADQRCHLADIEDSATTLLGLINTILGFARSEADRHEPARDPFDPRGVLGAVRTALLAKAREKNLELAVDVAPDVPEIVLGDADLLRQVLLNLVGNAIKFTQRGGIVIEVASLGVRPGLDPGLELVFAVADTGIGILPEDAERIFEPFTQADGSHARRFGGTGLGLTISKRLVERLGGCLELSSEPGRGSVFSFNAFFGLEPSPDPGP